MNGVFDTRTPKGRGNFCALLVILILASIQIYYFDVTIHGPDQIRDMEVARQLVQQGQWPQNGPPMFGERIHLTPFFYWLLALPLWFHDSDTSVFITFGLLFILSAIYLWWQVGHTFGWRCGFIYTLFAFPLFPSLYAHSAWSPGLVITFSNVLLGLYLRHLRRPINGLLALPWVFFLLVQIHPSAAPLLLGFGVYVLRHPRTLLYRRTGIALLTMVLAIGLWLLLLKSHGEVTSVAANFDTVIEDHGGTWLENLLDPGKWIFVALLPFIPSIGIHPHYEILYFMLIFYISIMYFGLFSCVIYLYKMGHIIKWIVLSTILWFLLSMGFLSNTGFWHFDVIHPWIAVAAAWGMDSAFTKRNTTRIYSLIILALFAMLAAHLLFYRMIERQGRIDLKDHATTYPTPGFVSNILIPTYSYRHLAQFRKILLDADICRQQLTGIEPMTMAETTLRYFENQCFPQNPVRHYFVTRNDTESGFHFTKELSPHATIGPLAIYAPKHLPVSINGVQGGVFTTDTKLNYMTYHPVQFNDGIKATFQTNGENIILRLGLRCSSEYPVINQEFWEIHGAKISQPMRFQHHRYLAFWYYDLEWNLTSNTDVKNVEIKSPNTSIHCDLSVIARPLTIHHSSHGTAP